MRDFVSMGVRGDSEFAQDVTYVAKRLRGKTVGDYIRDLIVADAGDDLFVAKNERQNGRTAKRKSAR